MTREGSLEAPTRHPLDWRSDDFYDEKKLDAELRRVFDICHGCRRCFNLCDSFPRLFDLVDESPNEVEGVKSEDFGKVTEACTLCDMCYMTKCPYVPPHAWNVDFPHLMLRHRAVEAKKGETNFTARQLAEMDRNGKIAGRVAPLANWASKKGNSLTRPAMEKIAGIDPHAELPEFASKSFVSQDERAPLAPNKNAPAFGKRKCAIYATCFVNYNKPSTGMAARAVLNHLGVETAVTYPGCCGMPFLEQADIVRVEAQAKKVAKELCALIDSGHDIVTLTASCGLMLKSEWKLIVPEDENVQRLARSVFDIDEYVVDIAKKEGLPEGLKPLPDGVTVHNACHARAQNIGAKAAEMLRLVPETPVDLIERCAGHGGTFGVLKPTHALAMKVGKPVMRQVAQGLRGAVASDCPLAGKHIVQGAREMMEEGKELPARAAEHPIEIFARAYGLM